MGFGSAQIHSLRGGLWPVDGFRNDLIAGETVTLSLVYSTPSGTPRSYYWQIIGKPDRDAFGGTQKREPVALGTAATASFVVGETGNVLADGSYHIECILNRGLVTETSVRAVLAEPNPNLIGARIPTAYEQFTTDYSADLIPFLRQYQLTIHRNYDWLSYSPNADRTQTFVDRLRFVGQRRASPIAASTTMAANVLYAIPYISAGRKSTFDVYVRKVGDTGPGAPGALRIGIYGNTNPNGFYPRFLSYSASLSTCTLTMDADGTYFGSVAHNPDSHWLWVVLWADAAFAARGMLIDAVATADMLPCLGTDPSLGTIDWGVAYACPYAGATMPSAFPGGASIITDNAGVGNLVPSCWIRPVGY